MAKRAELVGERFGHLVVESSAGSNGHGKALWNCRCDCGKMAVVPTGSLRSGNSKSCGCGKYYHSPVVIDMLGKKYNRLTVVGRAENGKNGAAMWLCECECGNRIISARTALVKGRTKSCGCYSRSVTRKRHSEYRGTEEARTKEVEQEYAKYKRSARVRGVKFGISVSEFVDLSFGNCHYCGVPPSRKSFSWGNDSGIRWNGIDRVNNDSGYIPENCVTACKQCNIAKNTHSEADFIAMCHAVASRHPLPSTSNVVVGPWADRNENASPLQWAVQ